MARPLLIGIGEILWDILPGGKQLGGAPANFAYHANALGGRGVVMSRVGDDAMGREILERLDGLGVDRTMVPADDEHPTGTVEVRLDEHGVPDYVIRENVAWDHLATSAGMFELAHRADCVCFGSLGQRSVESRDAIQAFLRGTDEKCLRVFDINLRQHYYSTELIEQLMDLANVLKLNDQEMPIVSRVLGLADDEVMGVRTLMERYGLQAVALTRGGAGSSIYSGTGGVVHQAGVEVKVADTVGAGDAFTAALALGMLGGMEMEAIGRRAVEVAAFVCSQRGATPDMPAKFRIM
jgi:fructokinase